jgi:GNAT superfamily N-acetyltransferase
VAAFSIRSAVAGDMPALREVFRRSSLSNDGDRADMLAHPEILEFRGAAVASGRTRVAVTGDGIAGFATWSGAGYVVEVEDLFVDPDRMRQGIGLALVTDLIGIARGLGALRVEVTANNHALAFYARAGFVAGREVPTRFGSATRMHLDVAR